MSDDNEDYKRTGRRYVEWLRTQPDVPEKLPIAIGYIRYSESRELEAIAVAVTSGLEEASTAELPVEAIVIGAVIVRHEFKLNAQIRGANAAILLEVDESRPEVVFVHLFNMENGSLVYHEDEACTDYVFEHDASARSEPT